MPRVVIVEARAVRPRLPARRAAPACWHESPIVPVFAQAPTSPIRPTRRSPLGKGPSTAGQC